MEDLTGFPEMLDGRVKTLHPGVHGGILAVRDSPAHMAAIAAHKIETIDVVRGGGFEGGGRGMQGFGWDFG